MVELHQLKVPENEKDVVRTTYMVRHPDAGLGLQTAAPGLHSSEIRVQYTGSGVQLSFDWLRSPSSAEEVQEFDDLKRLIGSMMLSESPDRRIWRDGKNGPYSVADLKTLLCKDRIQPRTFEMNWVKWVPLKVNIFVWRTEMNRIPTKVALQRTGVNIHNVTCSMCDSEAESMTHLFTGCGFSFGAWAAIGNWCNIQSIFAFDVGDLLRMHKEVTGGSKAKKIICGIIMARCWTIWRI